MKMEIVQKQLKEWGEIMITTGTGCKFELHLGDTEFDLQDRQIYLKAPHSLFVIDGDTIEIIEKHYGHAAE